MRRGSPGGPACRRPTRGGWGTVSATVARREGRVLLLEVVQEALRLLRAGSELLDLRGQQVVEVGRRVVQVGHEGVVARGLGPRVEDLLLGSGRAGGVDVGDRQVAGL